MTTRKRIAGFALGLIVIFGGAVVIGDAIGPIYQPGSDTGNHSQKDH